MICPERSKHRLVPRAVRCPWAERFRPAYGFDELAPGGMCLLAFYAAYPYCLTLTHGGWMSWVRDGDGVILQCPSPEGAVEMKVFAGAEEDEARIEILRARGACSHGHAAGEAIRFSLRDAPFCPKALAAFVPSLRVLATGGELPWRDEDGVPLLTCPVHDCGTATFAVEEDA